MQSTAGVLLSIDWTMMSLCSQEDIHNILPVAVASFKYHLIKVVPISEFASY